MVYMPSAPCTSPPPSQHHSTGTQNEQKPVKLQLSYVLSSFINFDFNIFLRFVLHCQNWNDSLQL
uniref:Uncharacterized protein n=1 Tax=Anguilla anguilla TaxID=7936 RepID=A0A0E9XAP3_ANGAN